MKKNHPVIISEVQKHEYISGYLLNLMANEGVKFNVVLDGDDCDLEPLFIYMMSKEYLDLDAKNNYTITHKGKEKLENSLNRYQEYLSHFDVYCAVDLENGEFAFKRFFELSDQDWYSYVNQDRFVDLRIAVAHFKKMNPADIVFLSFLHEGRFDKDKKGWQFDLLSGLVWDQITEIVEKAITIVELGYTTENNEWISGETVIEDVIRQGSKLNADLYQQEKESQQDEEQNIEYNEEETLVYEQYYDPYYVSPIWFLF